MYKKVLIATDGSPTATKAVKTGSEIAGAVGAETLLLYVGEDDPGKRTLDWTKEELGIDAATKVVQGDADDKILEVAETEGCDLIVVGNKGMTGAKRFLLGSVPNQISHHAQCNVLIVKTT